jgi:splicing factor 3B subunit 4
VNGQYLCGKPIDVTYAYKKDAPTEKHGSVAERVLAYNRPNVAATAAQQATSPNVAPQDFKNAGMPPGYHLFLLLNKMDYIL